MQKGYWELYTKEGYHYTFGKQAYRISYANEGMIEFHRYKDGEPDPIAAVPIENVSIILWVDEE